MTKKRVLIYLVIFAAMIPLVIMKQRVVTAKRNKKILSAFSEWQEHGKPVVLKSVKKENVKLFTKITIVPVSGNEYEGYVPGAIQEKLRPDQSFVVKRENGDVAGKVISVSDAIDIEKGLFRVRLSFAPGVKTFQKAVIAYVPTGMLWDVICVPNDVIDKEGDDYALWVAEDGRARKRTVTVKQRDGYGSIIEQGLKAGDQLIVQGFTQLLNNDKLNVLNGATREI